MLLTMKDSILQKNDLKLICPSCGSARHTWKDVYYDSGTVLKKAEKQYISWCSNVNQFVLSNNRNNI